MSTTSTPPLIPSSLVAFTHLELPQGAAESPSEAEIAAEAYSLFEARGCEHGHDVEDWLAAEAIVRDRRQTRPSTES